MSIKEGVKVGGVPVGVVDSFTGGYRLFFESNDYVVARRDIDGYAMYWTTRATAAKAIEACVGDDETGMTARVWHADGDDTVTTEIADFLQRHDVHDATLRKSGSDNVATYAMNHHTGVLTLGVEGSTLNTTGEGFLPLPELIHRTGTSDVSRMGIYVVERVLPWLEESPQPLPAA